MKVRNGFVSNSSSSSFCLLGMAYSDIQKRMNTQKIESNIGKDTNEYDEDMSDDDNEEDMYDMLEKNLKGTSLVYSHGYENYSEDWVVGFNPNKVNDSHTLKDIKKEVSDEINKAFKAITTEEDISFCIDGGYDS